MPLFETKCLQNVINFFNIKFWTMDILMNFQPFYNRLCFFYSFYLLPTYNYVFSFGIKKLIEQTQYFGLKKMSKQVTSTIIYSYQCPGP